MSSTAAPASVGIVGAGIGGLALARALELAQRPCALLEQAPRFAEIGAGLVVQPGALLALRRLGLEDAVRAAGRELSVVFCKSASGELLQQVDLWPLAAQLGAPWVALHRARLHAILLGSLARTPLHPGARCVGLEQDVGGVLAHCADGRRLAFELLVGADGLHSAVRRELLGALPPRYAGCTSWRGIAPHADPRGTSGEYWGRGERFGSAPISASETYWFAVANAAQGGRDADPRAALLARFARWPAPIPELIASTPPERIVRTDLCDRPPVARWSQGRVTLLGDAAHPTTPNLGLGACLAIEDAVVLARCLGAHENLATALRAYERARIPRTGRVVRASWRMGLLAQLQSPLAVRLRDRLLRAVPRAALRRGLRDGARCALD